METDNRKGKAFVYMIHTSRCIVVAGSRHRGWAKGVTNETCIAKIIEDRRKAHDEEVTVTSIGCDIGFGKAVKVYCEENGVRFFEFVVYFNGPRPKEEYNAAYRARNASLIEVGDEYYLFTTLKGNIDDLLERVRRSTKPYFVFDQDNKLVESRTDHVGVQPNLVF